MNRHQIVIPERAAIWAVAAVMAVISLMYLNVVTPAFDDMYLIGRFNQYITGTGFLNTALTMLTGGDLVAEYRTYGLSRLLPLLLFKVFGSWFMGYALVIIFSQWVTSSLIYKIARFYSVDVSGALVLALLWFASPFSINWSFHH